LEFHIVSNMKPKANIATTRKSKVKLDSTLITKSEHVKIFSS